MAAGDLDQPGAGAALGHLPGRLRREHRGLRASQDKGRTGDPVPEPPKIDVRLRSLAERHGDGRVVGQAIAALDLAREGSRVAVHYNTSADAAREVAGKIEKAGGTAEVIEIPDRKYVRGKNKAEASDS